METQRAFDESFVLATSLLMPAIPDKSAPQFYVQGGMTNMQTNVPFSQMLLISRICSTNHR